MTEDKKELWKDIPEYEGYYQASNLGRIRSLDRIISTRNGQKRFHKGRIINGNISKGYRAVTLKKGGIGTCVKVSNFIAMTFLDHKPNGLTLVVDHINGDKADDRLVNLRVVTHRDNCSICFRSDREYLSSKYVGVSWSKKQSKWISTIRHNNIPTYIGCFDDEIEASNAYQKALSKIKDGSFDPEDYKPKFTSKYKGIHFCKTRGKWISKKTVSGKQKHLGSFQTELEAHESYKQYNLKIKQ